ncbi:MAG: LysE/ArgO family amino acid transporter [Hyphomicrobiales bacterium]
MTNLFIAASAGFFLGVSLIVAIGAQNAFILRQGLLKQHVFVLCLICAFSDALLIAVGVLGFGTLVSQAKWLIQLVTIGGAIFLFVYGLMAFRRALSPDAMTAAKQGADSLVKAVATCLALTFLNPHVYLDTVVLLGGLSANYEGADRIVYGLGAAIGSFAWFFALGYGARLLVGVFENPKAWQVLDILIGSIMWLIAASLFIKWWAGP